MNVEMNASVKKVAEFMQRELPADELRGVANALAVIAPAIWGRYAETPISPMALSESSIQLNVGG